jgi:galactokinase
MAIDLGVEVLYQPSDQNVLVIQTDFDPEPAEIPVSGVAPGSLPTWGRLAAAVVQQVGTANGGRVDVRSNLPAGVGLSSSAAFSVALALALGVEAVPIEVARLCQRAEQGVGVPIGLMDPLVSMSATKGNALLIDFATLLTEPVAIPTDVEIVVIDSGTTRRLEETQYADRRFECASASEALGRALGQATSTDLQRIADPVLRRRAQHVISEDSRVREFVDALGHRDLPRAGALMSESHRSLRDDFEVSTPVLDLLVERTCATPGVYGARVTGAGFGGCVVAICRPGVELSLPNPMIRVHPASGASVERLAL